MQEVFENDYNIPFLLYSLFIYRDADGHIRKHSLKSCIGLSIIESAARIFRCNICVREGKKDMKILEKLNAKQQNMYGQKPVTIAFLGDSVTQGCYELYFKENHVLETIFDYGSAYSTRLREILNLLYPNVQVNIINSGISGGKAADGLRRLERDILSYSPDLAVLSFGLNDCMNGLGALDKYVYNISQIVSRLNAAGSEVIFLTQNYMNTKVSCHIKDESLISLAETSARIQNSGVLKEFLSRGAQAAQNNGAVICDLYSVWEKLDKGGVDVTELLANRINHPIRLFHYYMALKLVETFFEV